MRHEAISQMPERDYFTTICNDESTLCVKHEKNEKQIQSFFCRFCQKTEYGLRFGNTKIKVNLNFINTYDVQNYTNGVITIDFFSTFAIKSLY